MKRLMIGIVALGVLATATYFASARCSDAVALSTTPSADFLAAALRHQEQACGPSLEVEYTGEWQKVGSSAPEDRETAKYKYCRTPDALRVDKLKEDGGRDIQSYDRQSGEFRRLFAAAGNPGSGEVSQGLMTAFGSPEFLDTARYPLREGPLCERVAAGSVSEQKEAIDGHDCWRVEIPTQKSGLEKYIAWLDPEIGFCPRRITVVWKGLKPDVVSFTHYADLGDDVWFPKTQTVSYADNSDQASTFTIVNTVTKVTLGHVIPKSEAILEFPSGAKVHDALRDAVYTVP